MYLLVHKKPGIVPTGGSSEGLVGNGDWGDTRSSQFSASRLVWWGIKEKLSTKPGRVLRRVDCEADGPWVVENFIVISSLQWESFRLKSRTGWIIAAWNSFYCLINVLFNPSASRNSLLSVILVFTEQTMQYTNKSYAKPTLADVSPSQLLWALSTSIHIGPLYTPCVPAAEWESSLQPCFKLIFCKLFGEVWHHLQQQINPSEMNTSRMGVNICSAVCTQQHFSHRAAV